MLINMVDVHEQSEDKNDSEKSQLRQSDKAEKIIKELKSMYGEAKGKILELIETLKQDGLKDHEVKKVLFARVDFISRPTLYRALPQEFKREYTKPLPKTINISSEHKVIDVEPEPQKIEALIPAVSESIKEIGTFEEEDPKEIENQFLKEKVTELEDALKKTEQFKPATKLSLTDPNNLIEKAVMSEETVFEWLAKRDNAVTCHWYPNYGIELFKSRILTQLKGKGVTTFKRLYFEV